MPTEKKLAKRGPPGGAFEKVIAALMVGDPAVEPPAPSRREFGGSALKVNGKIFAMFVGEALVVKLPAARVFELVKAGTGTNFDAGKGRPMKEWVSVQGSVKRWIALAREARAFVGSPAVRKV